MDIKLINLLFTEAAPTPTEALQSGIAAVGSVKQGFVALLSYDRTIKVKGYVSFERDNQKLYKVEHSAGLAKTGYGVLTYQIVMHTLTESGDWLRSDFELSPDSFRVWQKMYELSDKNGGNVYKAKWLGDWSKYLVIDAIDGARTDHIKSKSFQQAAAKTIKKIESLQKKVVSEAEVMPELGEFASMIGNLWAYQLVTPLPQVAEMFAKGKKLRLNIDDVTDAVEEFYQKRTSRWNR